MCVGWSKSHLWHLHYWKATDLMMCSFSVEPSIFLSVSPLPLPPSLCVHTHNFQIHITHPYNWKEKAFHFIHVLNNPSTDNLSILVHSKRYKGLSSPQSFSHDSECNTISFNGRIRRTENHFITVSQQSTWYSSDIMGSFSILEQAFESRRYMYFTFLLFHALRAQVVLQLYIISKLGNCAFLLITVGEQIRTCNHGLHAILDDLKWIRSIHEGSYY